MKNILILGAGLSASSLIDYLLKKAGEHGWNIVLGDLDLDLANQKLNAHPNGKAIFFDINDDQVKKAAIANADVVVSLLPAKFHPVVAEECLLQSKHLFTASYISPQMKAMNHDAANKGLLFYNESGVDPGIDHMSAMKVINELKNEGAEITGFYSSTGGLVAPEFDNNPWNYKFTWNPRNVVLAGQATARYMDGGEMKYIPYHKLYTRAIKTKVLNLGEFEMYPNRDSLGYREIYGLQNVKTMIRGTFRRPGYCESWNALVQLGMTDDTFVVEGSENMSYRQFTAAFLPNEKNKTIEQNLCDYLGITADSDIFKKIEWLGLFKDVKIGIANLTPAQILQHILEPKWALGSKDLDLIVMQHIFDYSINGISKRRTSSMVYVGKDQVHTAMAITVGLPLAIAVKLFMLGKITDKGVTLPVYPHLYEPILHELAEYGVKFIEEEI